MTASVRAVVELRVGGAGGTDSRKRSSSGRSSRRFASEARVVECADDAKVLAMGRRLNATEKAGRCQVEGTTGFGGSRSVGEVKWAPAGERWAWAWVVEEAVAGGSETEALPGAGQRPLRTALSLFPCRSRGEDNTFRNRGRGAAC